MSCQIVAVSFSAPPPQLPATPWFVGGLEKRPEKNRTNWVICSCGRVQQTQGTQSKHRHLGDLGTNSWPFDCKSLGMTGGSKSHSRFCNALAYMCALLGRIISNVSTLGVFFSHVRLRRRRSDYGRSYVRRTRPTRSTSCPAEPNWRRR